MNSVKKIKSKIGGNIKIYLLLVPVALLFAVGVVYFSGKIYSSSEFCPCGLVSEDANGQFEEGQAAIFNNSPAAYDAAKLKNLFAVDIFSQPAVLGADIDERWIEVDLSEQKLFAHNGSQIDYEFLVSSGKWAPTPTGEYRIWSKFKYTKMSGGDKAKNTYYYLPNVPYTQYYHKGYGLHGAYWHNNFGQPMSHGCINLAIPDAEKLFYWTTPTLPEGKNIAFASKENIGTRVIVHD